VITRFEHPPDFSPAPPRRARATVLAAAMLTIMAAAIIAPGLPAMAAEFADVPGADLLARLAVTITCLAIAVTAPISGQLADRFGRTPLLVSGLVLYAVSGTAGLFIDDLYLLLFSRIMLGIAVGAVMTIVGAVITDWYDGPQRARWLGLQQAFASLGGVVFLSLAGFLAEFDWRAPFSIYAVAAIVALAAVTTVREPGRTTSATASEHRTESAGYREIVGIYVLALVATLAFYMAPTQLPFLLAADGISPTVIGIVIAASTVTSVSGALVFPILRRRSTPTTITALSVALLGFGWVLVGTAASVPQVLAGLLIGGFGVGAVVPNLNLRLGDLAPPDRRGRVLSGLVTAIFLGQFLSPLLLTPLVSTIGIPGAFTAAGITMVAGAALAAGSKKKITQKVGDR